MWIRSSMSQGRLTTSLAKSRSFNTASLSAFRVSRSMPLNSSESQGKVTTRCPSPRSAITMSRRASTANR